MSIVLVLLICVPAFLAQNVFGQCGYTPGLVAAAPAVAIAPACGAALPPIGPYAPSIYGPATVSYAPSAAFSPSAAISSAGYGGIGEGIVAVLGELPVSGNSAVAGQVPITGVVGFSGAIPATGAVSISGQCGCGCSPIY